MTTSPWIMDMDYKIQFSCSIFSESVIEECSFDNPLGLCPNWKNGDGKTEGKWRFSSQTNRIIEKGINSYLWFTPARWNMQCFKYSDLRVLSVSQYQIFWAERLAFRKNEKIIKYIMDGPETNCISVETHGTQGKKFWSYSNSKYSTNFNNPLNSPENLQ